MKRLIFTAFALSVLMTAGCLSVARNTDGDWVPVIQLGGAQAESGWNKAVNNIGAVNDAVSPLLLASGATGLLGVSGIVGLVSRSLGYKSGKADEQAVTMRTDATWDAAEAKARADTLTAMVTPQVAPQGMPNG